MGAVGHGRSQAGTGVHGRDTRDSFIYITGLERAETRTIQPIVRMAYFKSQTKIWDRSVWIVTELPRLKSTQN